MATVVCLYGENSASADNKYNGSFYIALPVPATRQYGFVTRGIRTAMVNRSAQVQTPAGLTDTESNVVIR